jgi:hypothetical protein
MSNYLPIFLDIMTFATKTNTGQIPNPKPSPLETVEIRGINAVVGLFPPNSHCHNENSLFGINAAFSPFKGERFV